MKKLLVFAAASLLTGCVTSTPVVNAVNVTEIDYSEAKNFKKGVACETYVLGFGPMGISAVHQAARNGDIKSISDMQISMSNYILFSRICTTVYGK